VGAMITYEDNGTGIPVEDKEHIFKKGFGKHTGLGLFLTREILAITNITIRENGETEKGVRFEILIPQEMYRIIHNPEGSP
jgi:signal transduction histidine kinase